MSRTCNFSSYGKLHASWRTDRALALQLGASLLLLFAALVTTGCGTSAQAAGAPNAHALSLSGKLPAAIANQAYNAVLSVRGGNSPYHFAVRSGSLPQGLTLNPATGSISGTPVSTGTHSFEIIVTDAPLPDVGVQTFAVTVGGGTSTRVSVSPATVTMGEGQKQQFTATVSGTVDTAVIWSASAGSIDAQGLYTAPAVTPQLNVIVTAATKVEPSRRAYAFVTVDRFKKQPPSIANSSLPQGQLGTSYNDSFTATGGTQPYSWSISAGALPKGITLTASGQLSGSPASTGMSGFTVTVKDAAGLSAQRDFSMDILSGGNFDGPAELPRVKVASAFADTPASGAIVSVHAGGDLQAALNSAHCGDTIELQAGATFSGSVDFPAKPCDNNHWIVLRTSAPDSSLPPEGQRLTPCYAGVASLPNRPKYDCAHPQNVLARLSYSVSNGSGPVIFMNGANHYRLIGLEITRPQDKTPVVALVSLGKGAAVDHLIFDRLWIHGTSQEETRRGVNMSGMANAAVVDSYLNDFHCTARSGTCTDSQAVSGGTGDNLSGPWKIENNFLEAAGENILFGGGPATVVPADITIRRNHFYKVPQWQPGTPGFVGGLGGDPFVVKNHFEIKNASRVLAEANVFEYSWGGFSQFGHSILVGPRNSYNKNTKQGNLCSVCEGTDITVRYNKISHVGAGFIFASVIVESMGAQAAGRMSIHDVVVEDIDATRYRGVGNLFLVMNGWPKRVLNNVSIRHVTGFPDPDSHLLIIGNSLDDPQMSAFTFTDNLVIVPQYPVWAAGKPKDCARSDVPATVMTTCFTTFRFGNNVLASSPKAFPPDKWPAGNMFPSTIGDIGFVNFNSGNGGDYHLAASSPYKGKASDGRDPGADIDGINTAIQGVQ